MLENLRAPCSCTHDIFTPASQLDIGADEFILECKLAYAESSSRAGPAVTGKRRIADGVLRKNGRPQYWGPALKKNKTDTMPLKPTDVDSLPPHVAATVRDGIYESHD
ncbi:hypothetical protein FOZ61_003102, partial [Perkinsus olseni]